MRTTEGGRASRGLALLVGAILAAGLGLRWLALDVMLFDFDEGIASIYAYQFTGRGILPLRGVKTSLEFYNPPLFIYFISIPYLFSRLPTVAVGFLQLLQIGTLGWLCRLLWRERLRWAALVTAVFGALTPGPLYLTARLWGHALIPVFSTLAFICVYALWRRPRCPWAAMLLPPAIAAAQQCHFSGALLLPMAALALLVERAPVSWRHLSAGCLLAAIMYTPYMVHLWQTDFEDVRTISRLLFASAGPGRNPGPMWQAAKHTFFDFGTNTALQEQFGVLRQGLPFASLSPWLWLCLLYAPRAIVHLLSRRNIPESAPDGPASQATHLLAVLGLIWCLLPLVILSVPRVELVPAYWLVSLPGPWMVLASFVTAALAAGSHCQRSARPAGVLLRWLVPVGAGLVLLFVAGSSLVYHQRYVRLMREPDPSVVVYPPYRDQRDAVWFICDHSADARVRLTQEDRTDAGGVDYQVLYLIAAREGNAQRFSPDGQPPPMAHYIIHNRYHALPRVVTDGPHHWKKRRFGLLDVYWRQMPSDPTDLRPN